MGTSTYESPQGTIEVAWQIEGATFEITVDVPPGSTAEVVFPDGEKAVLSPGHFSTTRPRTSARLSFDNAG